MNKYKNKEVFLLKVVQCYLKTGGLFPFRSEMVLKVVQFAIGNCAIKMQNKKLSPNELLHRVTVYSYSKTFLILRTIALGSASKSVMSTKCFSP